MLKIWLKQKVSKKKQIFLKFSLLLVKMMKRKRKKNATSENTDNELTFFWSLPILFVPILFDFFGRHKIGKISVGRQKTC